MQVAAELIREATLAARGVFGYLELARDEPVWMPPHAHVELPDVPPAAAFSAPDDAVVRGFEFLSRLQPSLPGGTFVFVLSDFLAPPPEEVWISALERHWDIVPVVIQDPVWERSFPDIGGVVVPLHDRAADRFVAVRMTDSEAVRQRVENESRATELLARLRSLDLEPVVVTTTDRLEVFDAFLAWADTRVVWRGRVW
jgi:hypothetical protein